MHSTVPAALLAAFLSTAAVTPAGAADIAPPQAELLQGRLQGWLQGVLGPDISPTVQVRPEGDHYRIELPLGTPSAGQPSPVTLSASTRPAEDGRWTFEGSALPSPASFTLDLPAPAKNGKAPGPAVPVEYTITTGSQDSRGMYDPSFATPSMLTTNARDVQVRAQGASTDQLTKIERLSSTSVLRPSGSNRVDFMGEGAIESYAATSRFQDGQPIEFLAQHTQAAIGITALSRDQAATMLPAVVRIVGGFLAGMPSSGKAPAAPPLADPQVMRVILQSLQDLASEFTANETLTGVTLRLGKTSGAASQIRIGLQAKSDGGLLQAQMELSLDGLVVSEPGLGAIADLLPRRVALRPVLTSLPADEVLRWLGAAGEAGNDARPPNLAMLLRRAGVSVGLESFAVDLGGASFTGTGMLTTTSPGDLAGQAQITAANFDELIARLDATPECAHLLPFVMFAKGVGQTVEGNRVWNIVYRNNKFSVNGTDLSAMMGRPPAQGSRNR